MSQEIKINIIEGASEIAIEVIKNNLKKHGWSNESIDTIIYEEETSNSLKLKEEYQNEFNELYNFIYDVLQQIKY